MCVCVFVCICVCISRERERPHTLCMRPSATQLVRACFVSLLCRLKGRQITLKKPKWHVEVALVMLVCMKRIPLFACTSRSRDACVYETHTSIRKDTWPKKRIPLFRRDERAVFCAFCSLFCALHCPLPDFKPGLVFGPVFFSNKKKQRSLDRRRGRSGRTVRQQSLRIYEYIQAY